MNPNISDHIKGAVRRSPGVYAEPDILDRLADEIKRSVKETCAKVAEIHHVKPVGWWIRGSYMDGYNTAVRDIAATIREL